MATGTVNMLGGIETSTPTITKSSGNSNVTASEYKKAGGVKQIVIQFTTTASIPANTDIFVGTISGIDLPSDYVFGYADYSYTTLLTRISPSGDLVLRTIGTTLSNNATPRASIIYI